jgi:ABC-type histidine transport system ATPase subunit
VTARVTTNTPVIQINGLHKAYGALEVLKGVDIAAPKGHVVSLIGSSGSGKSTLLRCCNLLEDSQQGELVFNGEPITWRGTGHAVGLRMPNKCCAYAPTCPWYSSNSTCGLICPFCKT